MQGRSFKNSRDYGIEHYDFEKAFGVVNQHIMEPGEKLCLKRYYSERE